MSNLRTNGTGHLPAWRQRLQLANAQTLSEGHHGYIDLLLDCSASMEGDNKLGKAKGGATAFVCKAHGLGFRCGLISFESTARRHASHAQDHQSTIESLGALVIGGSTNLADALALSHKELGKKANQRIICVVTDGLPDSEADALAQARVAKQKRIDIMAIGTDDANWQFLNRLVTRKELARKVVRQELSQGITDMVRLLPKL